MEIKIEPLNEINICPYCFGNGKLKAMQSLATFNGGSVRGRNKEVRCANCNGKWVEIRK